MSGDAAGWADMVRHEGQRAEELVGPGDVAADGLRCLRVVAHARDQLGGGQVGQLARVAGGCDRDEDAGDRSRDDDEGDREGESAAHGDSS